MPQPPPTSFKALADRPASRFRRLCRDGERPLRALTDNRGVSQPAVSKHWAFSNSPGWWRPNTKVARDGIIARSRRIGPPDRLDKQMAGFWESRLQRPRRFCLKRRDNETKRRAETRSAIVERDIALRREKVWRAPYANTPDRGWLMKNDFKPCRRPPFNLRGDWGACGNAGPRRRANRTLSYTWNFAHDDAAYDLRCSDLYAHAQRARGPPTAWSSWASGRIRSRLSRASRGVDSSYAKAARQSLARDRTEVAVLRLILQGSVH